MGNFDTLALADYIDSFVYSSHGDAAKEMRRLHGVNHELLEALKDIANYPEHDTLEMKRIASAAIAKAGGAA